MKLTKTGSSGNDFFYEVVVRATLDQTTLDFVFPEGTANIVITGTLLGREQITHTIPEPTSLALGALMFAGVVLRIRERSR